MTSVFRPRFGRVLSATLIVLCVVALAGAVAQDGMRALWQVGPWTLLVAWAVWALYWRPEVGVTDGGVHVVNVLRTIDIPWPAIQRVDTKWALTLFTAQGTVTAWAAPAPGGIATARAAHKGLLQGLPESTYGPGHSVRPGDSPASPSGAAAAEVRRHFEGLRDAGYLDNPRLEHDRLPSRWHWDVVVGIPAVVAVAVLTLLIG